MLIQALIMLLALTVPALAQHTAAPQAPSNLDQAISQKLMEEINANIQLKVQLLDAQAKIKELEAKKEDTNAKQKQVPSPNDGRGRP